MQGWETYDPNPRFGVNWFGMRGRLAILSEAYSNADLRTRVSASYNFTLEVIRRAAEEREAIRRVTATVPRPDSIAVRAVLARPFEGEVIAELTESAADGAGPFARRRRTGVFRSIRMPVFDRFAPARVEAMPESYLLPPEHSDLVDALRRQGVMVIRLDAGWEGDAEAFRVDSVVAAPTRSSGFPAPCGTCRGSSKRRSASRSRAPIAHGYLTLSLVSRFLPEIVVVKGIAMGVNYGVDKVRFPSPVRVGSRIRGRGELVEAETQKDGSVQTKIRVTVEIEGQPKPACVAETISRYYPAR